MKLIALGLLTRNPELWEQHVKDTLEFCDEYFCFEYGACQESAELARNAGAKVFDEPIDYLGASDTGEGLTTIYNEAYKTGADAVFMADPTDKFIGEPAEAVRMLDDVEVLRAKFFRARVTEQDEADSLSVYEHKHFEPEYNFKTMFCKCRPGRLFWGMYPFWPYGALSMATYGTTKSFALAHLKEAYRLLILGSAKEEENVEDIQGKAEDWIAHDMKSRLGNDLITEEEFESKGAQIDG